MKKTANNFILYVYLFIIIISIILRSKVKNMWRKKLILNVNTQTGEKKIKLVAKIDLPLYQNAVTRTNLFSPQSDAHFTPTPLPQKIIMFSATTARTTFTTSIVALRPTTKTTSKRSATFVVRFIILFAFLFPV